MMQITMIAGVVLVVAVVVKFILVILFQPFEVRDDEPLLARRPRARRPASPFGRLRLTSRSGKLEDINPAL